MITIPITAATNDPFATEVNDGFVVAIMYVIPETIKPIVANATPRPLRLSLILPTISSTVSEPPPASWAKQKDGTINTAKNKNKLRIIIFFFTII